MKKRAELGERCTNAVEQTYHFKYNLSSVIKMLASAKLCIHGLAPDINQTEERFHLLL